MTTTPFPRRGLPTATAMAVCLAVALSGPAAADFKRRIGGELEGAYVFRGVERADLAGIYSAEVELGEVYIEALRVEPIGADADLFAVETRGRIGWRPASARGRVEGDFGLQLFRRTVGDAENADHTVEAFAGFDIYGPLNPALRVYYDFDDNILTTEAGVFQYRALPMSMGLRATADAGLVSAFDDEFEDYVYVQGQADVVRSFLYGIEAYAGVRGAFNTEDDLLPDQSKVWVGAGASWTF